MQKPVNILSVQDRGAGTGSRFLITLFGRDNIMIGLSTRLSVESWIAAHAQGSVEVSPELMSEAMSHYYDHMVAS